MRKRTKALHRDDWNTPKAGCPLPPGIARARLENPETHFHGIQLYTLKIYGSRSELIKREKPKEVEVIGGDYRDYVTNNLTKSGQICLVSDGRNNKLIAVFIKNASGIIDLSKHIIEEGRSIVEFL